MSDYKPNLIIESRIENQQSIEVLIEGYAGALDCIMNPTMLDIENAERYLTMADSVYEKYKESGCENETQLKLICSFLANPLVVSARQVWKLTDDKPGVRNSITRIRSGFDKIEKELCQQLGYPVKDVERRRLYAEFEQIREKIRKIFNDNKIEGEISKEAKVELKSLCGEVFEVFKKIVSIDKKAGAEFSKPKKIGEIADLLFDNIRREEANEIEISQKVSNRELISLIMNLAAKAVKDTPLESVYKRSLEQRRVVLGGGPFHRPPEPPAESDLGIVFPGFMSLNSGEKEGKEREVSLTLEAVVKDIGLFVHELTHAWLTEMGIDNQGDSRELFTMVFEYAVLDNLKNEEILGVKVSEEIIESIVDRDMYNANSRYHLSCLLFYDYLLNKSGEDLKGLTYAHADLEILQKLAIDWNLDFSYACERIVSSNQITFDPWYSITYLLGKFYYMKIKEANPDLSFKEIVEKCEKVLLKLKKEEVGENHICEFLPAVLLDDEINTGLDREFGIDAEQEPEESHLN
jgi:hypothetical protein